MTTALPTQITYGTFKGKLIDAINTGAGEVSSAVTGTVTATPQVKSVNISAALVVMLPRPVTVTLDANGAFTMQLVATDDPALSVLNWAYQISFQLTNGDALAPFLVQIPGGAAVDLSTANPVSTGGGVAITQGNPGPAGPIGPPGVNGAAATTTAIGAVQLAGDLAGTAAAPTVPALAAKLSTLLTVGATPSTPIKTREITDPNRTASKWREVFDSGSFNTHPDPQCFFGWNADKAAGGGDPAEPAIYMGFEADYWDTATTRTMEWYVGVIRADSSGPQFRPFAFTAARDSNLDLSASVQVDIGNNANSSTRSSFNVVGNGVSFFAVTPGGATFASGQVNVLGVTPTFNIGDGTAVADVQINLNAKATATSSLNFLSASSGKWRIWTGAGNAFLATFDLTNNKYHMIHDPGATPDTATTRFMATPQLNGTQPTTAAAGTAAALPATPQGYFQIKDAAGVSRKVPYYV